WLIGFLFLLYIGVESIKEANQSLSIDNATVAKKSLFKSCARGILMALTPANLVFWIGVFGTALTAAISKVSGYQFLLVASGFFVGILIHYLFLILVVSYSCKFVNKSFIIWACIIAAVLLIGFSSYFGYLFVTELKNFV